LGANAHPAGGAVVATNALPALIGLCHGLRDGVSDDRFVEPEEPLRGMTRDRDEAGEGGVEFDSRLFVPTHMCIIAARPGPYTHRPDARDRHPARAEHAPRDPRNSALFAST